MQELKKTKKILKSVVKNTVNLGGKRYSEDFYFGKALLRIAGFNITNISYICSRVGISYRTKLKDIPLTRRLLINEYLRSNFIFEKELRKKVKLNISEEVRKGSYKGLRLSEGLPAHGQRTHSNGCTAARNRVYRRKNV